MPGVTRSRRFRGLAKLSPGCSPCPGDTERGSRCHPFLPLEGHSICRWRRGRRCRRECRRGSLGARAWREQELRLPRSAEGECAPKNLSTGKYLSGGRGRAVACAHWLPQGRWGCERRAPLPVSPQARPDDRVVARASSKVAPCANVREFREKSRARLIPET